MCIKVDFSHVVIDSNWTTIALVVELSKVFLIGHRNQATDDTVNLRMGERKRDTIAHEHERSWATIALVA